jgi:hypothetical protein
MSKIDFMTILVGASGSGKTSYFSKLYPDNRILHVSNLSSLRTYIQSVYSPLVEEKPTLINTWFDLDISDIIDLREYPVYIETHYMETPELKVVGSPKRYWGIVNENRLRYLNSKSVIYFPPPKRSERRQKLMELFGTRYNWIRSQFPDIME